MNRTISPKGSPEIPLDCVIAGLGSRDVAHLAKA